MEPEQHPVKHGAVCRALPGWDVQVPEEFGVRARPGESGAIAIRLQIPPGAIEEILCSHPEIAEAAVVGAADVLKAQLLVGLLVLKSGARTVLDVDVREVPAVVVNRIGSVVSFQKAMVVDRLPKARSGKTLRATIKKIADGGTIATPGNDRRPAIHREDRGSPPPYRLRPQSIKWAVVS